MALKISELHTSIKFKSSGVTKMSTDFNVAILGEVVIMQV
jgi:hypothetical protein